MSLDDAQRLIARMDTDEALRERVPAAPDVAARLILARAEGYDVGEEEIQGASAAVSCVPVGAASARCPTRQRRSGTSRGDSL